jgi:NAD(P)-dependent dehydrogenase (short-subunit alcohol dehydrogenase family)
MVLPKIDHLDKKVVVLTGGAGVLGEGFAYALAEANATVIILDLNIEKAKEIEKAILHKNQKALAIQCNVLDKENIQKAHDEVLEKFGKVDALINAAGGNHPKGTTDQEFFEETKEDVKTFFDLDQEGINFVFQLNFLGTLLPTQVFAKSMIINGGSIINISSMNAFTPLTKIPAYSGAKAAISNLTQWLAVHFSKVNIRVNAIAPGFFLTKQNENLLTNQDGSYTDRAKKIINQTPMSRFGESNELLGALLFLLNNDASSFINGIVLPVDGGFNAYSGV